ncbi:hypothetical protein U1Q18_007954 [Sarracenia purpurea var. burkii]
MERTEVEANILYGAHFPSAERRAYIFDGEGNFQNTEWVLGEVTGKEFCWYHMELPKAHLTFEQAECLLEGVLRPPFRLDDIQSLVSYASSFRPEAGVLIFIVNSPGHGCCEFPFRIAMRITENSVITVSMNSVPGLVDPNFGRGAEW